MGEVVHLFPTPVFLCDEKYSDDNLLGLIDGVKMRQNNNNNFSSIDAYVLNWPELFHLKKYIERNLYHYAHHVLGIKEEHNFYITQSWFNVNKKGTSHHSHTHPNSIFSGIFFVDGDDSCPVVFHNSKDVEFGLPLKFSFKEYSLINSSKFSLRNDKNTLVIFPSTLRHTVEENESDIDRVSLSFNTFVSGSVGSTLQKTRLILTGLHEYGE